MKSFCYLFTNFPCMLEILNYDFNSVIGYTIVICYESSQS